MNDAEERRKYCEAMAELDANPPRKCTKYEFVNAIRSLDPSLYQTLFQAYMNSPEMQFLWNTVNELDRDNDDFRRMTNSVGLNDDILYDLFHIIGAKRIQNNVTYPYVSL